MTVDGPGLFRVLLVVTLVATLIGCGRKGAEAEAEAAGTSTTPVANSAFDPLALRDLGKGLTPARGAVQVVPPGSLAVEAEPSEMNFGVLPPGAAARGTVRLWNVGSEELTITKSITSCGCTSTEDLAGRMIRSGGYLDFDTSMTMKSGLGEKKERITIYFEPGGQRVAIVYFKAVVSLPIKLDPPYLAASEQVEVQGSRPPKKRWVQTRSGEITLTALDGRPFSILRTHGLAPDYVGFDPDVDAPRAQYTVRWDLDRFEGVIPWFWVIETDRPDCPIIDARVQHSSTMPSRPQGRQWVPKDQRLLVGIVRKGEPFEVTTSIEYAKNYPPDPGRAVAASESTLFEAELLETQVEDTHLTFRVRLTVTDAASEGLLYGTLVIGANGFTSPLYVIGRVE
jgi:hypothetical protein